MLPLRIMRSRPNPGWSTSSMTAPSWPAISTCPKIAPRRPLLSRFTAADGKPAAAPFTITGARFARNGYALFAVDYRLAKQGAHIPPPCTTPKRRLSSWAKAAEFDIDPDRIVLMGDSAGGYLAALLALAGDQLTSAYGDDPYAAKPINVKAVVGFYGIYDMLAQ